MARSWYARIDAAPSVLRYHRPVEKMPPLLVARLLDLAEVEAVVDSALGGHVALVPLEEPPTSEVMHAVLVHAPGLDEPLVLSAAPAGEGSAGLYPLQVQPLDAEQAHRLQAFKREHGSGVASEKPSSPPPSRRYSERPVPGPDPMIGTQIGNGKYEIEAVVGGGAFGKVYRARHRALNKPVAIKVLLGLMDRDPGFAARFEREALAASKLDHPNVTQVLDFGQEPDGMLYLVMELLEGRNLRDVLLDEAPLDLVRSIEIMCQVCAALSAAHDAGVVHRDIKPENLVIVPKRNDEGEMTEVVKVCDFGIATVRNRREDSGGHLSTGGMTVVGTPEYMAPEQARGEQVDPRADLYACGILLYEMACGRVPFESDSAVAILVAHVSDPVPPPSSQNPQIDPRLEAVILKALAKKAPNRHQTARELRAELRRISGSRQMKAVRPSELPKGMPHPNVDAGSTEALRGSRNSPVPTFGDEPAAAVVIDANASPEVNSIPPMADVGPPPPSLADPQVGFSEFLAAVTSAIARTTYYERAHPEFARSLVHLSSVMSRPLDGRVEITLARRDQHSNELVVMTGWGEMLDVTKAVPGGVGVACAQRLGETFIRRGLVSLTFKEGLDDRELGDAVELLSGPEIPPKELQAQFVLRGLTKVSLLFVAEMLGKERRLPWQVMLALSRIARDLEAVPKIVRGADPDRKRRLRTALTADVTRTLRTPEQVKLLLTNWDIIGDSLGPGAELSSVEIPQVLIGSLAHPTLLRVASLILIEMEKGAAMSAAVGSAVPPSGTSVHQLMQVIGARFIRERTIESDDVLRELHSRAVLSFPELPEDVQLWVLADQQAEAIAADPESVLRVLDSVYDLPRYRREMATLSRAMRVLARRGEVAALWTVVVRLQQRHARGAPPGDDTREGLAASALAEIVDADVLAQVASVLLTGAGALRDPAHGILVTAGEVGAQALCNVRAQGGETVRVRFVEAMKEIGRESMKPLSALVARITGTVGGDEDAALAEDVLRAMPEIEDERVGTLVSGLLRHRAPTVRRAAASALASPWGAQARAVLIGALDDVDEGVRVVALTGLRKVGVIDHDTVRRVERILTSPGAVSDNLCAVAVALLGDVVPEAREAAVTILCNAIQPRTRSLVTRLTGGAAPLSHESTFVVETMARVLVSIGGARGRDAVKYRASKSSGLIKERLDAILQNE